MPLLIIFASKTATMTIEEAEALYNRLKVYIIGTEIKEKCIESLFIGPTDWETIDVFLNKQIQEGMHEAINAFIGKSFSVYGTYTDKTKDVPITHVTILDYFDSAMDN